jgi:surface carbohydrate biosynthesis protein
MLDFLICYEHINREIENDALIKYELEKRGYSCEIIPFNGPGFFEYAVKHKAKVVVTPWLRYDENVFHYLQLARKPYKLVNLQWEQIYCSDDLKSGMCAIHGQSEKAKHICWGENSKQRLSASGVHSDNLFVTGAIQMDFGRKIFSDYYVSRKDIAEEFKLNYEKKWFLYISSFAYSNYGEASIRKLEKQFNFSLAELVKLHTISQQITLDWIEQLLQQTDCEFIYRPHPSENTTQRLVDLSNKYSNFHIFKKYSVKQWAKVCDKINLWISTSNAEVLSMGKNYTIIRPVSVPDNIEVESMYNETFVTDLDAFIALNSSNENDNSKLVHEREKRLSYYYSYDPDYPAYVKVVDVLEQVYRSDLEESYHFTIGQGIKFGRKELRKAVISFIMEKQLKAENRDIISKLPLKGIIKRNLYNALNKYREGKAIEAATLKYLKEHNL